MKKILFHIYYFYRQLGLFDMHLIRFMYYQVIYELQKKQQLQQQQLPETPKSSRPLKPKSKSHIKLNKLRTSMPSAVSMASSSSARLNAKSPRLLTPIQSQTTINNSNSLLANTVPSKSNTPLSSFNSMNSKILTKQVFSLPKMKHI